MNLLLPLDSLFERVDVRSFYDSIDFRVARTKEELEKAYSLVYEEYLKRGYTNENPSRIRLSLYNALPETTTFIAIRAGEVIATATIIPDSPLCLPMDEIYHTELDQMRHAGSKICEITMLASKADFTKHAGLSVALKRLIFILQFFKILLDYVKDVLELDYMCITINPKYNAIFDLILFKDMGGLKSYEEVNGAPAIAKYLNVHGVKVGFSAPEKKTLYTIFVDNKTSIDKFTSKISFAPYDLKYFFLEKTDIFKKASSDHLQYIKERYATEDLTEILN